MIYLSYVTKEMNIRGNRNIVFTITTVVVFMFFLFWVTSADKTLVPEETIIESTAKWFPELYRDNDKMNEISREVVNVANWTKFQDGTERYKINYKGIWDTTTPVVSSIYNDLPVKTAQYIRIPPQTYTRPFVMGDDYTHLVILSRNTNRFGNKLMVLVPDRDDTYYMEKKISKYIWATYKSTNPAVISNTSDVNMYLLAINLY